MFSCVRCILIFKCKTTNIGNCQKLKWIGLPTWWTNVLTSELGSNILGTLFFFLPPLVCPVSYLFFLFIYTGYVLLLCHFYQAAIAGKISNLLICFCSFELSCPTLESLYILLSCPQKHNKVISLKNKNVH